MEYTIRQVSELTGLSASTLRFYEKEQLFPPVERNEAGVRVYREQDLERISLITCLKNTDMPHSGYQGIYGALRGGGRHTAKPPADAAGA